jgi:DNA-binding MarR family transcriptional regulator
MPTSEQQHFSLSVKRALLVHPRYTTVAEVARALGYHRNTVSRAINRGCYQGVRKRVARLLDLPIPAK